MKKIFYYALFVLVSVQAVAQTDTNSKRTAQLSLKPSQTSQKEIAELLVSNIRKAATIQFQYFIIKADSNTYGYSIYADGNLYIQQNIIPAIAGTKGFADTASAAKTAQLVIQKIKKGEIPPAITIHDLKKIVPGSNY